MGMAQVDIKHGVCTIVSHTVYVVDNNFWFTAPFVRFPSFVDAHSNMVYSLADSVRWLYSFRHPTDTWQFNMQNKKSKIKLMNQWNGDGNAWLRHTTFPLYTT